MHKGKRIFAILSLLLVAMMVMAACGQPAPAPAQPAAPAEAPAAPAEAAPAEAAPTEPPAEEPAAAAEGSERSRTLIMDIDGGRLQDPEGVYNPYVPGNRRDQGFHQVCLEPLFILNYQTGDFEPWLGESFVANDTLDQWTLTLRDGSQ